MEEFEKDGIRVTEPRTDERTDGRADGRTGGRTGYCREKMFEREKVTERRSIGRNEIIRTTGNWKNWRETVRDHGRNIAERIYQEQEED